MFVCLDALISGTTYWFKQNAINVIPARSGAGHASRSQYLRAYANLHPYSKARRYIIALTLFSGLFARFQNYEFLMFWMIFFLDISDLCIYMII